MSCLSRLSAHAFNLSKICGEKYPGFKDLSNPEVVKMKNRPLLEDDKYEEEESILVHLTVTKRCYAKCIDCVNIKVTQRSKYSSHSEILDDCLPDRDVRIIKALAALHPGKIVTVCFYGGEPFLSLEAMEQVWRALRISEDGGRFRFMVYTNGELIGPAIQKFPELAEDIWLYSVSIDGDEKQHERFRKGTSFSKIIKNLEALLGAFKGKKVLFWSTLREGQSLLNCFKEFMRLYEKKLVSHFFWHWAENRKPLRNFKAFINTYGRELEEILEIYVKELGEGNLLPIVHLNELILYLLKGKQRGHSACGVELCKNYDIVGGKVYPCADFPDCRAIGGLDEKGKLCINEENLLSLVNYKKYLGCFECGVHAYCGGRCPVQILAGSLKRSYQYCQLMRLHVGIVQRLIKDIKEAIKACGISLQKIYDHSAFLAQYTDVVP